jgi:YD repeat-containing protein
VALHEYTDAGLLTAVRTEHSSGRVDLQRFEYDPAGRLSRIVARSEDTERVLETYEYDQAGRKSKIVPIHPAGQDPPHLMLAVEGTDAFYSAPGAVMGTTRYNLRDQPAELLFHDREGRLLSSVEFKYDGNGNLVQEAQTHFAEMFPSEATATMNPLQREALRHLFSGFVRSHRYDEHGRPVDTRYQMGPLQSELKTMICNDRGDVILETVESEDREFAMDDDGQFAPAPTTEKNRWSEARFSYQYDAKGNWVSKTVENRHQPGADFIVCSVERRAIGYFE